MLVTSPAARYGIIDRYGRNPGPHPGVPGGPAGI